MLWSEGWATGGGYAQVVPMEDINLHFTGDIHAVGAAHNLLAAMIDNHIKHGNELGIDPTKVYWNRSLDINDRALRKIIVGLGGHINGMPRESSFMITVASEVMAILCLSENISDLKARLGKIIVGRTYSGEIVTAKDLNAHGAMAALLKEALKPNLVQTLENTPAIIHGGPFANIAHGCNSILATKIALSHCDYVVTEAGFGADLGAEKFFNIKCRIAGFTPDCVVIVATARALKMHGGVHKSELKYENLEALAKGLENLEKHIENIERFKLPVVVAINKFHNDTEAELSMIKNFCDKKAIAFSLSEVWEKGGEGGLDLAQKVMDLANEHKRSDFRFLYDLDEPLSTKIEKIATEIYGADSVVYSKDALKKIDTINSEGFGNLPICMAKTQNSISDDPTLLGRPKGFRLHVRDLAVSAGAGFIVVYTGDIMTMPGLPKKPAAVDIDIDDDGKISGLF